MMDARRRRWTKKGTVAVVAVVVVAGGGIGLWLGTRSSSPAAAATTETEAVTTGTISESVSATGTIEPADQANLDFGTSGTVDAVDVTVGQKVTAGQTLATLDTTTLTASVGVAQATVSSDESKLATDEADGASSAQIAADNAAVASAQTQLNSANQALADATLTSTITGTVAAVNLTVGQQVSGSAGSSSTSAGPATAGGSGAAAGGFGGSAVSAGSASSTTSSTAQIEVVSTSSYIVNAAVDDTEVGEIADGDQATITLSGSTTPVYGTVGSIGLLATSTSGVASFPVVIDVTGDPPGLYGGISATVTIIYKELQDVVVVPTAAIHYSGSTATVDVVDGSKTVSQTVTVGSTAGAESQITSGLKVGQKISIPVIRFAVPGAAAKGTVARGFGGGGFGSRGFGGGGGFGG